MQALVHRRPRNHLFREFVGYVRHFKPKHFLMENVLGMTSYKDRDEKPVISVIKGEFEALGYSVDARSLIASDYEVPQARRGSSSWGLGGRSRECRTPNHLKSGSALDRR